MNWLEDTVDRLVRGVSGTFAEEIKSHPMDRGIYTVAVWGPNGYGLSLRWADGQTKAEVIAYRCTSRKERQAWGIPDFPKSSPEWMDRDQIKAAAFRLSLRQNNFADTTTNDHKEI